MRSIFDGFMQRHLRSEVWVNGEKTHSQPIDDPFATVKTEVETVFSFWDRIKLLFTGRHTVSVRFHIQADGVATKRWFSCKDACERCAKTIGYPHDGSNEDNPGYHHGEERLCEECYYNIPVEALVTGAMRESLTPQR